MSGRLRVALLAGGRSSEHDISLASARSVLQALDPERYDVVNVQIGRDGRWELEPGLQQIVTSSEGSNLPMPADERTPAVLGSVDVVLPILHGPFGEDGTVQGLLELLDVAYVGSGVAASALAMDKDLFKKVMRDSGIPVARHHTIRLGDAVSNPFGYPVFVKPARLGSSVGISKVRDESSLAAAVALARRHDEKVLVEEFVEGLEVEVGVLGNRVPAPIASLPGAIDTLGHDWYDFASKYDADGMQLVIPPELPQATDGDAGTFWYTEHYTGGLGKPGVGLVLDAGRAKAVKSITVQSATPGFTAEILAGNTLSSTMKVDSTSQRVGSSTTYTLRGATARYYVLWITNLGQNASVDVNEVTAKG